MQIINKITQLFADILTIYYFRELGHAGPCQAKTG